jgi:hypothetical protein
MKPRQPKAVEQILKAVRLKVPIPAVVYCKDERFIIASYYSRGFYFLKVSYCRSGGSNGSKIT